MRLADRSGFTLFLTFIVVLLLVFATLMAQTNEMIQLMHMQKQAFRLCSISVETTMDAAVKAESALPPR